MRVFVIIIDFISSIILCCFFFFFFSSRRRHTRCSRDWSSDVCSSDLVAGVRELVFLGSSCIYPRECPQPMKEEHLLTDRKSTRLNSSHGYISYAVFCLKKKKKNK